MKAALLTIGLLACGASEQPQQRPVAPPSRVTATASVEAAAPPRVDPWTSAVLARSNATATSAEGFELLVTKNAIALADGTQLTPVPPNAVHGVDASYKRNGPNDLYIEPLAKAFQKQSNRDAVLAVDPSIPYRLLVEVLFTLGQNEAKRIHLLVRTPTGTASIEPALPRAPTTHPTPRATPSLDLLVIIARDGISMKARGGNIAPGCKDVGAGLAIPNKDGARDMAALAACAQRLKNISPDFASELSVTIATNADVDFQTLVEAMDALRPTFPIVTFGLTM